MVGDGRRLATELVVIMARATQEIHATAGTRVRTLVLDAGWAADPFGHGAKGTTSR